MDENKDMLTPETEEKGTDTDTVNEYTEHETPAYNAEGTEDDADIANTEAVLQDTEAKKPKKKRMLQVPIIISLVIVIVAALALFIVKGFFATSIVGTWVQEVSVNSDSSSSDEADKVNVYYTYNSDGTMTEKVGSIEWSGTYTVSTDDNNNRVVIINLSQSQSSFNYDVSGNMFTGRTLVFTTQTSSDSGTDSSADNKLEFKSGTVTEPKMTPDKNFKANSKLTGKWSYNNGYNTLTYDFGDDGYVTVDVAGLQTVKGTYTYTDNVITIKYCNPTEVEMNLSYSVEKDGLKINDILYTKDTGETATTQAATEAAATETK